ncbi:pectinesterase precursor [Fusarium napiforme]|uniref:pectinesterase n=1 Tax=Fusarium napiforme TaxID=42672 RepID=A0A8H5N181_9HYPO|nr:pectinesterase precursor [Fusarium napiforme]
MIFTKGLCQLVHLALFFGQCRSSGEAASLPTRADKSRTVAPENCIVVKPSGASASEFTSLQAAVNSIGSSTESTCIFLNSGTYNERVEIKVKAPLTLYGSTTDTGSFKKNTVVIQNILGSQDAGSLDASSTVNLRSNDFAAYNIDFVNGYTSGQAVALTANGNKTGFYGCSFKSYQDTLYVKAGWMYYSNCAVDYIFGNGHVWIGESTIASNGPGYITASSRTEPTDSSRYIIDHSTITSTGTQDLTNKVYLGRPWRVNARVMYRYSTLTSVVRPEGYSPMAEGATPIFQEFGNTGAGANTLMRKYFTPSDKALTKQDLWGADFKWSTAT